MDVIWKVIVLLAWVDFVLADILVFLYPFSVNEKAGFVMGNIVGMFTIVALFGTYIWSKNKSKLKG